MSSPAFDAFAAAYDSGKPQVIWTRLIADLETPVSALMKLADGRPNSFLLESVEGGRSRGRYSLIGLKPDLIWRCRGDKAEINRNARFQPENFEREKQGALASLRALIAESRIALPASLPPMASGLFGYMAYDMIRLVEKLPDISPDNLNLPDSIFLRPTVMAIFDSVEDMITVVTPVWPGSGGNARAAYNQALERLSDIVADLDRSLPQQRSNNGVLLDTPEPKSKHGAGSLQGDGQPRQGIHPGRRHFPGGAVAAFQPAVPVAAFGAVSLAAPAQSVAVPVLSRFRRLLGHRLQSRDTGAAARRRGHHPPDRRHPAARQESGRGSRALRRPAGRSERTGRGI